MDAGSISGLGGVFQLDQFASRLLDTLCSTIDWLLDAFDERLWKCLCVCARLCALCVCEWVCVCVGVCLWSSYILRVPDCVVVLLWWRREWMATPKQIHDVILHWANKLLEYLNTLEYLRTWCDECVSNHFPHQLLEWLTHSWRN